MFCFLGARFDLEKGMQTIIQKMLASHSASARDVHSLLGQMESVARLLPYGRAHKHLLQWHVKDRRSQATQSWDYHISLGPWFRQAVEQWLNKDFLHAVVPVVHPQPDFCMFMDASLVGWGAHLGDLSVSGQWSVQWSKEHINVLELWAVWLALKSFRQVISGCRQTTQPWWLIWTKEGEARSWTLSFMATKLLAWRAKQQVSLTAKFLPGKLNLLTDSLSRKDHSYRVDSPQGHSFSDFSLLGSPAHRSVCHETKQPTMDLCISISRPLSLGSGCHVPVLGVNVSICISSHPPSFEGAIENGERDLLGHSDSYMLGQSPLLSSAVVSAGCSSDQTSLSAGSSDPTSFSSYSSKTGKIQSARMVVLQGGLKKAGFSKRSAERVCAAKRASTRSLYNYRWNAWMDRCLKREMDPIDPSVMALADFLIFLFEEKKLAPVSVKGYRSAISSTLKHLSLVDFSSDPVLSDIIKSMELEKPVVSKVVPHWDLSLVLDCLKESLFEPMSSCSLKCLTQKIVFLIALASGQRHSEIHALSASSGSVNFSADKSSIKLHFFPRFLAKNQELNQVPSVAGIPLEIPSLSRDKGRSGTLLYPVGALRFYMRRTRSFRRKRKRLFISFVKNYDKEISPSTLSRWIVDTVHFAYGQKCSSTSNKICADELRALSASFAWLNGVPLDAVLRAGFWRSEYSFIKFYLRDTAGINGKLFSLGPIVASQTNFLFCLIHFPVIMWLNTVL